MKVLKILAQTLFALTVSSAALGQEVYESKDAQGNAVFSDSPSRGAEVIEVPPTNSADPLADIPAPQNLPKPPLRPSATKPILPLQDGGTRTMTISTTAITMSITIRRRNDASNCRSGANRAESNRVWSRTGATPQDPQPAPRAAEDVSGCACTVAA